MVGAEKHAGLPELFSSAEWGRLGRALELSPRQVQVARWMCRGLGNQALAARLGISSNTVRMHRRALFEKLGIVDRIGVPVRLVCALRKMRSR